jgi:hypothetical protein
MASSIGASPRLSQQGNPLRIKLLSWGKYSCRLQVGELLNSFASPFRLVICINPASLSHIPYQNSPLRIAYSVQEQDSKPTGRSSPSPLAANTYSPIFYGHAFTTP